MRVSLHDPDSAPSVRNGKLPGIPASAFEGSPPKFARSKQRRMEFGLWRPSALAFALLLWRPRLIVDSNCVPVCRSDAACGRSMHWRAQEPRFGRTFVVRRHLAPRLHFSHGHVFRLPRCQPHRAPLQRGGRARRTLGPGSVAAGEGTEWGGAAGIRASLRTARWHPVVGQWYNCGTTVVQARRVHCSGLRVSLAPGVPYGGAYQQHAGLVLCRWAAVCGDQSGSQGLWLGTRSESAPRACDCHLLRPQLVFVCEFMIF